MLAAPMAASYDVIVLGVGAMGAAAAWALARRGARVLGLEQHAPGHGLGSSGGQTRLVRQAYFEHPDYVPLLRRAYRLWDELGEASGSALLFRTGLVCAGRPDGEFVAGTRRAAREHGLALEELDAEDARRRFPALRLPPGFDVLLEPQGGFVLAERGVEALVRAAEAAGARIEGGRRVLGWEFAGGEVEVRLADGRARAARLVVTAGPWAARWLGDLGLDLGVTRQTLGWFAPSDPAPFELGAFPCWAVEDARPGAGGLYYGFPILPPALAGGPRGLKAAHHLPGPRVDPEAEPRDWRPADEPALRAGLEAYLPRAAGRLVEGRVCLYTLSPDGHFVIDRHPAEPALCFACGFSGHGFKFAPVVGEALADLALEGRTELEIGFLGSGRFAR